MASKMPAVRSLIPIVCLLCLTTSSRSGEVISDIITCPSSCTSCDCCSVVNATNVTSLRLSVTSDCQMWTVSAPRRHDGNSLLSLEHSDDCLTEIPAILNQYRRLVKLVLSRNRIETFTFLPSASTLVDLDLSHNLIEQLPGDVLQDAASLRHLILSHNRISSIAPGFFHEGLSGLKVVDLSHNQLVRAEAWPMLLGPFCLFDLSHNLLSGFSNANNWTVVNAADRPLGPGFVDLSHNQFQRWFLEDLSIYGFSGLWSLLRLTRWGFDLRENPWVCDCSLRDVLPVFQLLARFEPRDYFDVKCHSPPKFAGRTVLSLSLWEMLWC